MLSKLGIKFSIRIINIIKIKNSIQKHLDIEYVPRARGKEQFSLTMI